MRHALLALGLAACVPRFEAPDLTARVISCDNEDVCLGGQCRGGRCYPKGQTFDTEPATLLSCEVLSALSLRLTFSEPVIVADATARITPELGIVQQVASADARSLVLFTDPQVGERPYALAIEGVEDFAGNVAGTLSASFFGFGVGADTRPPDWLAPEPDRVTHAPGDVLLAWTARSLARSYSVEVSPDPEFTRDTLSWAGTGTQVSLATFGELQPWDYYLRVRTDASEPSAVRRVVVMDPARLYAVSGAAQGGAGNRSRPFASINAALIAALASATQARSATDPTPLGVREVALASGTFASEVVQPRSGSRLVGGYDAVSWLPSGSTSIVAPTGAAFAVALTGASGAVIERVTIALPADVDFPQSAALLVDSSPGFLLRDAVVTGGRGQAPAGVWLRATRGPHLENSVITGTRSLSGAHDVRGVFIDRTIGAHLDACLITGTAEGSVSADGTAAVVSLFSSSYINNSTLWGGTATTPEGNGYYRSAGLWLSYSNAHIDGSLLSDGLPGATASDALASGLYCTSVPWPLSDPSDVLITNSNISAVGGTGCPL